MIELEEKIWNELLNSSLSKFSSSQKYDVDELLNQKFENKYGIVYFFYTENGEKHDLKYIGKSTGKGFKTRLKAHFYNIGIGTQSKFKRIQFEKECGRKVYVKYIITNPIYLRNFIEEMLIDYHKTKMKLEFWNYKD